MKHLLTKTSVFVLAMALVVTACGQAADTATLNVASVPKAEVFVDGVSHGQSGQAIDLSAGEHTIEFRLERFVSHEETVTLAAGSSVTREVTLAPKDPSDPIVIAKLAECEGVDVAPFVAPETHRGSRSKRAVAVLLYPAKHIRKAGLINYAVEADETYEGDGTLEFRVGSKVIYREAFNPESVTTVRAIPAEVLEQVKIGREFTWGLYFEDSRRPIKKRFKIVQRPKAERQLAKLASSRHMKRQPLITQQIMAATVLENNRLYTEALVANLSIVKEHDNSTMPYRGIVTTLRRLDAENSELFAFVSPRVAGKGGRSGISRPSAARAGGMNIGIGAWLPAQQSGLPTSGAIADNGSKAMGPGSMGVTPSGGTSEGTSTEPGVTAPSDDAAARSANELATERMRSEIAAMDAEGKVAQDEASQAQTDATDAAHTATQADATAAAAEATAKTAREAVENAADPTREQQETMYKAGMAAEEAREAASSARQASEGANEKARAFEARADQFKQSIAQLNQALEAAQGKTDALPGTELASAPTEGEAKAAFADAQARSTDARKTWDVAKAQQAQAEKAFAADPSETNRNNLENAASSVEAAAKNAYDMGQVLETAKRALDTIGSQVQEAVRK